MTLLDALRALKEARDPSARALTAAWRVISDQVDRRYALPERIRDDVRQRTLLKVLGAIATLEADTPARAEAWLRTVHRSARIEHERTASARGMEAALRTTPRDEPGFLDRAAVAPEDALAGRATDDALAVVVHAVLDRVSAWLSSNVAPAMKRQGDYRRAQIALLVNVRGLALDEVIAELGVDPPPSKDALSKWVERGREQVLLPALEGWDDPIAAALKEHLVGRRRSDRGRARPARRSKPEGAVSRPAGRASPQKRPTKAARRRPSPDPREDDT